MLVSNTVGTLFFGNLSIRTLGIILFRLLGVPQIGGPPSPWGISWLFGGRWGLWGLLKRRLFEEPFFCGLEPRSLQECVEGPPSFRGCLFKVRVITPGFGVEPGVAAFLLHKR